MVLGNNALDKVVAIISELHPGGFDTLVTNIPAYPSPGELGNRSGSLPNELHGTPIPYANGLE